MSRSGRDSKEKVSSPPENKIPIVRTVASRRRLGGCLCPRISVGVVAKRRTVTECRTRYFISSQKVTVTSELGLK